MLFWAYYSNTSCREMSEKQTGINEPNEGYIFQTSFSFGGCSASIALEKLSLGLVTFESPLAPLLFFFLLKSRAINLATF